MVVYSFYRREICVVTENIDSKMSINWRKESVDESEEPPGNVESHSYRKQNHTAKEIEKFNE